MAKTASNLEQSLYELEQIVSKLEQGQMTIDEAIAAYTKGMELAAHCRKSLDEMSKKVAAVNERLAGQDSLQGQAQPQTQAQAPWSAQGQPDNAGSLPDAQAGDDSLIPF